MSKTNMTKTVDQVEWCLINRPGTRSDDNLLTMSVWKNYYLEDFKDMIRLSMLSLKVECPTELRTHGDFKNLPSSESCSRCRRKFNEKGKYIPDPETVSARRRKEIEVNDWSMSDRDHL